MLLFRINKAKKQNYEGVFRSRAEQHKPISICHYEEIKKLSTNQRMAY